MEKVCCVLIYLFISVFPWSLFSGEQPLESQEVLVLNLETATQLALESSFPLRKKGFEVEAQSRRFLLNRRAFFPDLSLNYSDSRGVQYNAPDSSTISLSATVKQPIFMGGRSTISREIQKAGILLEKSNLTVLQEQIKDECFKLFYQYIIQEQKNQLLARALTVSRNQLAIAETELQLGAIREVDFLETGLQVKEFEQNVLENGYALIRIDHQLKRLLGLEKERKILLQGNLDRDYPGVMEKQPSPEPYIALALENNPTVAQNKFRVDQARAQIEISQKNWLPNISLEGTASVTGRKYPLQNPGYNLKLNLEFPNNWLPISASIGISSTPNVQYSRSGDSSGSIPRDLGFIVDKKLSEMALLEALQNQEEFFGDMEFQITMLLTDYELVREKNNLLREKIEILERKSIIMETQLNIGEVSRIDFLEVQNQLIDMRIQLLESVLGLVLTERSFEQILGIEVGGLVRLAGSNIPTTEVGTSESP